MGRLDKRLEAVARRAGACPQHGTRLWCAVCDLQWHGTDDERRELHQLLDSFLDTTYRWVQSYGPCAQHRDEPLYCSDCALVGDQDFLGERDMTPEVRARYLALLSLYLPPGTSFGPDS
jgi:hypothetical protein